MNAVEIISSLPKKGVGYITIEQARVLLIQGAIAGKESTLEIPVKSGIRYLATLKLDISYTKIWVRSGMFRAEIGSFAFNANTMEDAAKLLVQAEDMHYRELLGEV
jgi:hypothetical protein